MNKIKQVRFSTMGNRAEDSTIVSMMSEALTKPDLLSLAAGFTDNEILPKEKITSIVDKLFLESTSSEYLQYGINQGRSKFRKLIADFFSNYPNESADYWSAENIIVTNGSQQALYLAAQILCDPGDIILVQQPSYFVMLEALKGLGVQAVSIPTFENGNINFDEFSKLITGYQLVNKIGRIKALYMVTYYANPTSQCLSLDEKKKLGNFINSLNFSLPVIEDAAYREFYFSEPYSAPSTLSLAEFKDLPVLYTGTFTKPFATGLKVGFACVTDNEWRNNILRVKAHHDFGTANFNQAIIEQLLLENTYSDHLHSIQIHYFKKMRLLDETLRSEGLNEINWNWEIPTGGLLIWLKGPDALDTSIGSEFYKSCIENNVIYVPGNLCFAHGTPLNYVRLSYGAPNNDNLVEAAKRFVSVAKTFS